MIRRALSICVAMVMAIAVNAFAQLRVVPYVSGLSAPVEFVQDPSSPSVQFVVEQGGRIRVIENGVLLPTPFLDVSGVISAGGERGLLGLAFSPDYAVSRRFFVNFTDTNGNTVVARFKRSIGRSARRRSGDAVRSAVGRRPAVHRAAVREPQRWTPRVRS